MRKDPRPPGPLRWEVHGGQEGLEARVGLQRACFGGPIVGYTCVVVLCLPIPQGVNQILAE